LRESTRRKNMSTSKEKLVRKIEDFIRSRQATSLFINGAPGSGKTAFLSYLSKNLDLPRCDIFGPYEVSSETEDSLGLKILNDVSAMGLTASLPPDPQGLKLLDVWKWVAKEVGEDFNRTFVVLFDLNHSDEEQISTIGKLFSSIRVVDGLWDHNRLRIHHTVVGYWDQHALYNFYGQANVSFPYTVGYNYEVWNGLTRNEFIDWLERTHGDIDHIYGHLLFELAGGHPGVAAEILDHLPDDKLSLLNFLAATKKAASEGKLRRRLISTWRKLPEGVKELLEKLAIRRHLSTNLSSTIIDQILISGLVGRDRVGTEDYLSFRSWYIELVFRLHITELDFSGNKYHKIQIEELVPPVTTLNTEAYRVIHDIENTARNFVAIQFSLCQDDNSHILRGKNEKIVSGQTEDQFQRANQWQAQSKRKGIFTEQNPLLAYCSTSDLANLIRKISIEIDSKAWEDISEAVQDLVPIRDAVMHNQLISDQDLGKIYRLRNSIYDALSTL